MKMHKHTGKLAGLTLFLFVLAVSLAGASDFSDKAAIANDRTQNQENRMKAILDLGSSSNENAVPILLCILKSTSEDQRIRTSAVLALENIGTPRLTIIRALETAYSEPDAGKNFRYTVLMSMGKMKAVESLDFLTHALSNSDNMIRMKAFQALGALKNESALQVMARYLSTEQDYMVRAAGVRAAGKSRSATAEAMMVKALRNDPAPLVRYNAAILLRQFDPLSADAKAAIETVRNDESPVVRKAAKEVLP